jgi:ABC-type dipeptide/oligopeptide/nickel transport system permease component
LQVRQYVIRRLLVLPLIMIGVSIIVFALTRFTGSPIGIYQHPEMSQEQVAELAARYHLDAPVPVQYVYWLKGALSGDLGWSGVSVAPVLDVIPAKLTATLELAIAAGLVAVLLGMALGTIAGARKDRLPDHAVRVFAISGASLPVFWFGLLLLIPLYVSWGLFPLGRSDPALFDEIVHVTGMYTVDSLLNLNFAAFVDALWHLALPAITLGYATTAIIARMMRSSMADEMREDYVDAARAKGLSEKLVIRRHARRNALVPTVTVIGLSFGFLLQGTVVVELIFRWPGLGQWVTSAILAGDQATVMAYVLITSLVFLLVNLLVDVAYAYLDRRVVLGA